MSFRIRWLLVLATPLALGAASPTAPAALQIKLFTFAPKTVTVVAGEPLVVTNGDATEHTITFGTPEKIDPRIAAKVLVQGAEATITPKTAGTYPFFCERHPFMTGTLTVTPK